MGGVMPDNAMETKDIITAVAAIVGMMLGIYNFIRAWSADRVKLQVIPKASSFQGNDQNGREFYLHNRDNYDLNHPTAPPDTLSLEIINMSKFAVTVDEVGLMPSWSRKRMALVTPIIVDGGPWPRKLEPRESVIVRFDATRLLNLERIGSVKRAYASTVCGKTSYGSSGALRQFIRIARGVA
ncbi:MAG: hypothetical protein Tsb0026_02440 [Sulfuricaulis sp.]